jgi:hypothetical protein
LAKIPQALQEPIAKAFPANVPLIGTTQANGYAQIGIRGSTMVYDDEHFALWERGRGTTNAELQLGAKVTIFFRDPALRENKVLPVGGIARFYGTVDGVHKSGPVYDKVWEKLIQPEKNGDPEKKGYAVTIKVDRAEDLRGQPLAGS